MRHGSLLRVRITLLAACLSMAAFAFGEQSAEKNSEWRAAFAQKIYSAWRQDQAMPQLNVAYPKATLADGYTVQAAFVKQILANDAIGGFKAAVVGAAGQKNLGIDGPITGVLPASGVYHATEQVLINLADTPNRHIETEIAYTFRQPIAKPFPDVAALRQNVGAVLAVIEVPGGLTEDKQPGSAADIAAWNGNAKAIILGADFSPEKVNPDEIKITLKHNDVMINEAQGSQAKGGQWASLLKAVNNIIAQGYTIEAGQVFINGALGKILKAEEGRYQADYGPLGVINFRIQNATPQP